MPQSCLLTSTVTHTITPMGGFVGAAVDNIDLSLPQSPETYAALRTALGVHGILIFRDQDLTVNQYVALGEQFGTLEDNDTLNHVDGYPQVGRLVKEAGHVTSIGDMWHVDHTYLAAPVRYTMLRAIEVPKWGGDTLFLSAKAAFASLPEGTKDTLRSLRALHSRSYLIRDGRYAAQFFKERPPRASGEAQNKTAIHPAVTRLPDTGEEVLFLNPGYVVKFDGWTAKLSAGLLDALYTHCLQPEYQCRFSWQPGSIVIWDNLQTWHFAVNDYQGERREMERLVIG
ncbi:TauD/TfdA dioxygenase family protein [Brevundimonas sp.]|uniref:TauD/TfdA dioxygenase family protein n=1 Tax=Brevundimonas sp. TaxID=1871086 RepID=UPI003783DD1C